jgi:hypothetical protein
VKVVLYDSRRNMTITLHTNAQWSLTLKGKVVPALPLSTTPWRRIGGAEAQLHPFLDLRTRRRWVVSFTTRMKCQRHVTIKMCLKKLGFSIVYITWLRKTLCFPSPPPPRKKYFETYLAQDPRHTSLSNKITFAVSDTLQLFRLILNFVCLTWPSAALKLNVQFPYFTTTNPGRRQLPDSLSLSFHGSRRKHIFILSSVSLLRSVQKIFNLPRIYHWLVSNFRR